MIETTELFYFCCYPGGNRTEITVIDLSRACSYERDDWDLVDDQTFDNRIEAILHARSIAKDNELHYQMFNSRYNHEDNEYPGEFGNDLTEHITSDDLERILMKVRTKDWEQMIEDIKSGKIDGEGGIRLRLFRLFSDF